MDPPGEKFCLILGEKEFSQTIESTLKIPYSIQHVKDINKAISSIKQLPVVCIIIHLDGNLNTMPTKLLRLKTKFPTIPVVAVLNDRGLELALKCGKLGVDSKDTSGSRVLEKFQRRLEFQKMHYPNTFTGTFPLGRKKY